MANENKKVVIDIDAGIALWNKKNPEKRQMTRKDVYENENITKTTIQNWKKGQVPKAFEQVVGFLERTGLKMQDIIKATDKNGKSII